METKINEIEVNGVKYIPKDSITGIEKADNLDGMPFVMIRTYSAGVHFGYLEKREGLEVTLRKSRRVFYWSGAASLSQLAAEGTIKPNDCKITMEIDSILLTQAIEVIPITKVAQTNLNNVKVWKM